MTPTINQAVGASGAQGGKSKKKKNKKKNSGGQGESGSTDGQAREISSKEATPQPTPANPPAVSIIPLGSNSATAPVYEILKSSSSSPAVEIVSNQAGEDATGTKKKKKKNKNKKGQGQSQESTPEPSGPVVTIIPTNKDPGHLPDYLNPAIILTNKPEPEVPRVIEASPAVTLVASNRKNKAHGALYNPPKLPPLPKPVAEAPIPEDQVQKIGGGFQFPSSFQPVFETPESIAATTGVSINNSEASGVLTIVPVRADGEKKKKRKNRTKLPPCCELRGTSNLEVVCPHSNKPIPNYNCASNEDKERYRIYQETQQTLERIEDKEILESLANVDTTSVTIKLVEGGKQETVVHPKKDGAVLSEDEEKFKKIVVEAAGAMAKKGSSTVEVKPESVDAKSGGKAEASPPQDAQAAIDEKERKAREKALRKAEFEAKRAAEIAAKAAENKANTAGKSKAELRAEARAKQEEQRAKKAAEKESGITKGGDSKDPKKSALKTPLKAATQEAPLKKVSFDFSKTGSQSIGHFGSMHRRKDTFDRLDKYTKNPSIHPAFLKLGFQIAQGLVNGSNQRCIALLTALKTLIQDFEGKLQAGKRASTELRKWIDDNVRFLEECRPLSVSMMNALQCVKSKINEDVDNKNVKDIIQELVDRIDTFQQEEIVIARTSIINSAANKIVDGDVILTYSRSTLVRDMLVACHVNAKLDNKDEQSEKIVKKNFRVIVVDSRPRLDGKEVFKYLSSHGIPCTYVLINAVSYVMKEVTKVMMGADTLLANGYVGAKIGSSQISMIAKSFNVPVLVCCETYKFSERVHTDHFVCNELGSSREFVENLPEKLRNNLYKDMSPNVKLVDLTFDITPPEFVRMVITEKGVLPCSSVPVVLRVRHNPQDSQ